MTSVPDIMMVTGGDLLYDVIYVMTQKQKCDSESLRQQYLYQEVMCFYTGGGQAHVEMKSLYRGKFPFLLLFLLQFLNKYCCLVRPISLNLASQMLFNLAVRKHWKSVQKCKTVIKRY